MKSDALPVLKKREIDWAQYLDFTRFTEVAEIENQQLEKFRNGFNI